MENPKTGGSYSRDPVTGALTLVEAPTREAGPGDPASPDPALLLADGPAPEAVAGAAEPAPQPKKGGR